MWPIGHAAVAYLLYSLYGRWEPEHRVDGVTVWILLFGSVFPDLVDKPLAWYFDVLPTGRSLAHSLLLLIPLCLIILAVAHRYGRLEWGIAFGIGAISHALVDALPVLWRDDATAAFLLYPLVAVEPYDTGPPSVLGLMIDSMGDPYVLLEFVLFGVALVLWSRHGYPGLDICRRNLAKARLR